MGLITSTLKSSYLLEILKVPRPRIYQKPTKSESLGAKPKKSGIFFFLKSSTSYPTWQSGLGTTDLKYHDYTCVLEAYLGIIYMPEGWLVVS